MNNINNNEITKLIKSKNHELIKQKLVELINNHLNKIINKNLKQNEQTESNDFISITSDDFLIEPVIMSIMINGHTDKIKYFKFTNKYELLKKIIIHMYEEIKVLLYYEWNENIGPIHNLEKILLENDYSTIIFNIIDIL